jgi:hypothetical protein
VSHSLSLSYSSAGTPARSIFRRLVVALTFKKKAQIKILACGYWKSGLVGSLARSNLTANEGPMAESNINVCFPFMYSQK